MVLPFTGKKLEEIVTSYILPCKKDLAQVPRLAWPGGLAKFNHSVSVEIHKQRDMKVEHNDFLRNMHRLKFFYFFSHN